MEIVPHQTDSLLTLHLKGRLDSTWCATVEEQLLEKIRSGQHRISLDMSEVDYISSSGLRVLLTSYQQIKRINGFFAVSAASKEVTSVLELAGFHMLLTPAPEHAPPDPTDPSTSPYTSKQILLGQTKSNILCLNDDARMTLRIVGDSNFIYKTTPTPSTPVRVTESTVAFGIGEIGREDAPAPGRQGELIAAMGCAAYHPTDGESRPDFMIKQGALVPDILLSSGFVAEGEFSHQFNFETSETGEALKLSQLAWGALKHFDVNALMFLGVVEVSGLVGATVRQDPRYAPANRMEFPQIRDFLSFSSERIFRESTVLIAGVAGRLDHPDPNHMGGLLKPLSSDKPGLLGHFHASAFSYGPVHKGMLEPARTIQNLFQDHSLEGVLHLLGDDRNIFGVGESEFRRGAIWLAKLSNNTSSPSHPA